MSNRFRIAIHAVLVTAITIPTIGFGQAQQAEPGPQFGGADSPDGDVPDTICQLLFDTYLLAGRKINSSTVSAAIEIVSDRGRNTGFAPVVLQALVDEKSPYQRQHCIRVLGKMLATDAAIRQLNQQHRGLPQQRLAPTAAADGGRVPREVIDVLIRQGRSADRLMVDHYLVALVRAGHPDARPLFEQVFYDRDGKSHRSSARFHAAVGLAQLGDPNGYRWLVEQSVDFNSSVWGAWPSVRRSTSLDHCCIAALQQLTDSQRDSHEAWVAWWNAVEKKQLPQGRVRYFDP